MIRQVADVAKRIVSVLIIIALYFCPSAIFSFDDGTVIQCGFDGAETPFSPVSAEALEPFSGMFCAKLQKSGNIAVDGGFLNFYDYEQPVTLVEGDLYEFSLYVKADSGILAEPQMSVDYIRIEKRIVFNITSLGCGWQKASGTFMAGATGEYNISFATFTGSDETTVCVDEILLRKVHENPVSMQIKGPRSVFVPDTGVAEYEYSPVAIDDSGNLLTIVTGRMEVSGELPDGVSFSADTNILTVASYAETDKSFVLKATPLQGFSGIKDYSATLKTGKNFIENGDFTDFPALSGYRAEIGNIYLSEKNGNPCAAIETEYIDGNKFCARIATDKTYVLRPDRAYIFRAAVCTDNGELTRQAKAENGTLDGSGNINIRVSPAGIDASEVISVVKVPSDGVYQLYLDFESEGAQTVYVSHMQFYAEELKATDIAINAPLHAAIPSRGSMNIPINYAVRNQAGEITGGSGEVVAFIEPAGRGVEIIGNSLYVTSSAVEGEYKLYARMPENPLLQGVHTFYVSRNAVYDGSFDTQSTGELFKTASPSEFSIVTSCEGISPPDGEYMGKLNLNGNVSALISDSVCLFEAGKGYVFSAWAKGLYDSIPTTLSVIIYSANAEGFGSNLPLFQVDLAKSERIEKVFVTQQDIFGRIMLGFTTGTDSSQTVLLDDIKISDASVSCSEVYISGYPYPDMVLKGKYDFSANFPTSELSTYRWLISSSADGVFMPLEGENSPVISVTRDMVGSYLRFEVAPGSLSGPVYGDALSSAPVYINPRPAEGEITPIETPVVNRNETAKPAVVQSESLVTKKKGVMGVINIYSDSYQSRINFADTQNHWAKADIDLMSAAGILNGRGDMLFFPDEPITRAEFSAFLIRAFSLAPLYYSNSFKDVHSYDWYAGVVETVTKYDIARGYSGNVFMPMLPITREEMTVMTVRALNLAGVIPGDGDIPQFSDSGKISAWAQNSIGFACDKGIVNGDGQGLFRPADSATRAEAAAVIKRMITYVINS